MMKQQERVFVLLLALTSSTIAFTSVNPSTTCQPTILVDSNSPLPLKRKNGSHRPVSQLHNSNRNNDDNLGDDWKTLSQAASSIAGKVGSKVRNAVQAGGAKLKEFVSRNTERLMTALLPPSSDEEERTTTTRTTSTIVDTQDEDLFRSVFGKDFVLDASRIDRVVDEAALLIQEDDMAALLLGSSLQYGRPFSQSSSTTIINGKTASTVEASVEVWGTRGQGVASVASSDDGQLTALALEVNGRLYRIHTTAQSSSSPTASAGKSTRSSRQPWNHAIPDNDDAIEVEVLEGIRRASSRRVDIMDAEILDKTTSSD